MRKPSTRPFPLLSVAMPLAVAFFVAAAVAGRAHADDDRAAHAAIGRRIGDAVYGASFKNMKDEMQGLASYKGKTLILYLWATWCAPCRIEAADLVKLRTQIGDRNIAFVAIAMSNGDDVRQFVADHGIDYTMLYGGRNAMALGEALGNPSSGVPFFAIVRDGVVIDAFHGDMSPADLVARADKPFRTERGATRADVP